MFTVWITGAVVLLLTGCAAAQVSSSRDWVLSKINRNAIIKCSVDSSTSLSSTTLHLYQWKPGEEIRRIMHFPAGAQAATHDKDVPSRYNGRLRQQTASLTISSVKPEDAAVYYCALWNGDTVLNCSSGAVHKPVPREDKTSPKLSAYPVSQAKDGKSVLLCQARGMIPDQVTFTWKDQNNNEVKLSDTDDLLEQRDEGEEVRVTSMLIIDQQTARSNTFTCSVQHDRSENNDQSITIPAEIPKEEKQPVIDTTPDPDPTCPPPKEEEEEEKEEAVNYGLTDLARKLYLYSLMYLMLLLKNVVYFFVVCVLPYKRRAGNTEFVSSKPTRAGQVKKKEIS